jgi:HD-GYP domain-containing protein (c-di-GMP phosphodiesterase class II)
MGGKHSLKTFVHRTLIIRLVLGGLFISILISIVAFLSVRDSVSELTLDRAIGATRLFNQQNMQLFDAPLMKNREIIQKKLLSFSANQVQSSIGRYVFARLYTKDVDMVGELRVDSFEDIDDVKSFVVSSDKQVRGDTEEIVHKIKRLSGRPYLYTIVPVVNSKDDVVGFFVGMFAPSDKTVRAVRMRGVKTMLAAILVVLLTTALLYPVIITLTKKLSDFSIKLLDANIETLNTLGGTIALRDSDTNSHNYRVTIYSVRIAEAIGIPVRSMQTLIKGAFLHDVGKIGIEDRILLKPGRLDENEFSIMKKHVDHGETIVERSEWLKDALEVVGYHHEKVNGEGYPRKLSGEDIPVTARIFAIADVFDALTSKRPYKDPFSFEDSIHILEEGRESHFDSALIDAFKKIAKPLYDSFADKDKAAAKELEVIVRQYFTESMESLDY